MATEKSMLEHIHELVAEEKQLRSSAHHTAEDRARLQHLQEQLDQCWDLLRQRRAKDEFGQPADDVKERPVNEVEGYLQ